MRLFGRSSRQDPAQTAAQARYRARLAAEQATPALALFCGAYLNQDWPEEYGDDGNALAAYLNESDNDEPGARLVRDIELVLASSDETEVAGILDALGSAYTPEPSGLTYRAWLAEVAQMATQYGRAEPD